MRTVVLLVPAFALAAACLPADAQNPYGNRLSSLMPLPQVANYSAPTAAPAGPTYYPAAPTASYPYASPAPYQPAAYPAANTHHRSSPGSYRTAQGSQRNSYFGYASQSEAYPPQQTEPAPPYQGGEPQAVQEEAYPPAEGSTWGASGGCDADAGYGGEYGESNGGAYGGGYAGCAPVFAGPVCPSWHVGVYALFMNRVDDNPEWFSFDTNDESVQLMKTTNDWSMGAQLNVTHTFSCCRYGLQAVYWGLFGDTQEMNLYGADMVGNLNTVFDFDPLVVNNPDPNGVPATISVNDLFDDAFQHRLRRSYEVHNVEINFLAGSLMGHGIGVANRGVYGGYASTYGCDKGGACGGYGAGCSKDGCCAAACGPALNVGWLFGFRYFKFHDDLQFATDRTAANDDELFYEIDVDNNLFGLQLGFGSDWAVTDWLHLRAGTKFGLYANAMDHTSCIYGANGNAWVNAGPNAGLEFGVDSSDSEMAFLGELDLGVTMNFTRHLTGSLGYRVVAANNVAVATAQIPRHFAGIQDVEDIDSHNSLVLHGAYAGIGYTW